MKENLHTNNCQTHVCHSNLSWMLDNYLRKIFQNPRKIVAEYINKNNTVIDLGCGPGFFTTEMAKMVGPGGKVIAADLQPEMLSKVQGKAVRENVAKQITYHKCKSNCIGINQKIKADFILAYYMVHETPNYSEFFSEISLLLQKGGKFLIVEPKFHVNSKEFEKIARTAEASGFKTLGSPKKKGGWCLLLTI